MKTPVVGVAYPQDLRIQRHLFGCLYVEQAGNFSRWDRDLDLSFIALSDLPTIGRWVLRVNNSFLRPDCRSVVGATMVRRSLVRSWKPRAAGSCQAPL